MYKAIQTKKYIYRNNQKITQRSDRIGINFCHNFRLESNELEFRHPLVVLTKICSELTLQIILA